jgi:hypothetical protein
LEQSQLTGDDIIQTICKDDARHAFRILVVTNSCKAEGEYSYAEQLRSRLEVQPQGIRNPLFAFSKSRIPKVTPTEPEHGESVAAQFAEVLQRLWLASKNQELADQTRDVLAHAMREAYERLNSISLHEFMYAVTQSAEISGESELGTLLRLLAVEQRHFLLKRVSENANLRALLEELREAPPRLRKDQLKSDPSLKELREREIYWPAEIVNKLYEPIALGDIFAIRVEKELPTFHVTVCNECDATLRADGTRTATTFILCSFQQGSGNGPTEFQMTATFGSVQRIKLNEYLSISADVLDLCWTNPNGQACFPKDGFKSGLPLLPSQKARLKVLKDKLSSDEVNRLADGLPFAGMKSGRKNIRFGIQRVGRINAPYAQGLMAKFAATLARPSFDHDYSEVKEVKSLEDLEAESKTERATKTVKK